MLWQWFKFERKILVEFCSNSSEDLTLQVAEKKGQITFQKRSSLYFLGKQKRTQLIYHALSLRSNLHKPFIIPTSPQICWCCQVGKIIQADNINDWTHHSGIILREREKGGKNGVRVSWMSSKAARDQGTQNCTRKSLSGFSNMVLVAVQGICGHKIVGTSQLHSMNVGNGAGLQHLGMLLRISSLFPGQVTGNQSLSQGYCACFWYLLTAHLLSHPQINLITHYHQPRNYQTPNKAFC